MKCIKYKPVRHDQAASVCEAFWQSALTLSVPDKSGELDFSTFLSVMHAQIRRENPRVEILRAVRLMDAEKRGFIAAAELRARLTGFGERLADQEGIVRSNLRIVRSEEGRVYESSSVTFVGGRWRCAFSNDLHKNTAISSNEEQRKCVLLFYVFN